MFGVAVPASIPDDTLMKVHPTQIYETVLALAIWGFALWLFRRRPEPPGMVALAVFALLAVERFLIEILRAKDDRFFGGFTLAQALSIAILLTVAIVAWGRRQRLQTRTG
jgi:phosphatidylglycerol:prolipoprotein diacylglycerol transferase